MAGVAVLVPAIALGLTITRISPRGVSLWQGIAIGCAGAAAMYGIAAAAALLQGHSRHGLRMIFRTLILIALSSAALSIDRLGYLGPEEVIRLAISFLGLYVAHLHLKKEPAT